MENLTYIFFYISAGAAVGVAIGITGAGGGSLMTPLLLLFGFPLHIAVGTDLIYATVAKSGALWFHSQRQTVQWDIVTRMLTGSIPGSLATVLLLKYVFVHPDAYSGALSITLGLMLIGTALTLVFKNSIQRLGEKVQPQKLLPERTLTIFAGLLLGILVTLSSVGAAIIGTALLMLLYPKLSGIQILGTNIAHAVPLTLIAGSGHAYLGNVNYQLLVCLIAGSMPAVYLGSRIATRMPDNLLQKILVTILFGSGIKFTFF